MNDKSKTLERLKKQISQAETSEEILATLQELDCLAGKRAIEEKDAEPLGEMAFQSLQDLTLDNHMQAKELILDHLLPLCLRDETFSQGTFNPVRARKRLMEWASQYPSPDAEELRDAILAILLKALDGQNPAGACVTLAVIGFRRQDIVDALWRIVERENNEIGDTALSSLVNLAIPDQDRERALNETHQRITQRYNLSLITILYKLADKRSITPILTSWLMNKDADQDAWNFDLTLSILSEIADANDEDGQLQDTIRESILKVLNAHEQKAHPPAILLLGSYLVPRCNSPQVIYDMLHFLQNESEDTDPAAHHRYLIRMRLAECIRPRQLEAWQNALNGQIISILSKDACLNTQYSGRNTNKLMLYKETAWETLLSLGCSQALGWFESAVAGEANPFVRKEICHLFACFQLNDLPNSLIEWITERYDTKKQESGEQWIFRLAAIDLAGSAASRQAFRVLLKFGLTLEGDVHIKVVEALANIAFRLIRAGDIDILRELVEVALHGDERHHRLAAAGALESLARRGILLERFIPEMEKSITDPKAEMLQCALLAGIFGFLPKEKISACVWQRLYEISKHEETWIASHALEALARHDRLVDFEDLLSSKLALRRSENQWNISQEMPTFEWAAYFTAWLYRFHPQEFQPAITGILSSHQWFSVAQILEFWEQLRPKDRLITAEVQDVLIQRAIDRQKASYSEKGMFRYLALFTPDKFIHYPWEKHWKQWIPEARQALAEALRGVHFEAVEDRIRIITLLTILIDDGLYAVRRSAYRTLALQSPESLNEWVKSFSQPDATIERRKRAAEVWGWLPDLKDGEEERKKLFTILVHDPELSVREVARRSKEERRTRIWAESYLKLLLDVSASTHEEILKAWPYAKALAKLGDDHCLWELRKRMQAPDLPPHVKFWLNEIIRELESNWQKTTREWPQPWIAYEGRVVTGQGALLAPDGQKIPVLYTIWHKHASDPSQCHGLKGMFAIPGENLSLVLKWIPGQTSTLQLEQGTTGVILITGSYQNWFYFTNQGPFQKNGVRS